MNFKIIDQNLDKIEADFEVIFIVDKKLDHKFVKDEFEFYNYDGTGVLTLLEKRRVYVGVKALEYDKIRTALNTAYNTLKSYNISSIKIATYLAKCTKFTFQAVAEGLILGSYAFDKYKSDKKEYKLNTIYISTDEYNDKDVDLKIAEIGLKNGSIMANAANYTKDGVNEIPEIYTPIKLANEAEKLAAKFDNIECKIYDEEFLKKEGMNAFLAVNKASVHPPRLIHLKYTPKVKALKKIIFVGKGLTYDSGGLSLKPSNYMLTMKCDKSGALATMGIIKGATELDLPFEIHAIIGATENMIGGNAFKPDDVVISRSGVTIEVRNTDAEGRLVLADCLSYAQDFEPDLLIDMATLTGACAVGLGQFTTGILGNNFELMSKFKNDSEPSGELFSIFEFNDYLRELIDSGIADVSNTSSSRYGGTTTAGIFLDKFIKDEYKDRWLHLDIAGPAYVEKAWGYNTFGASGAGVRSSLYFLENLAKELK
ncbi:MAG: leucyl aminopeptidase [Campylobacter sp.]|nr:leucyl aminopeptidase [Campylobacter sp.]